MQRLEPSPEQIKGDKLYGSMGLTDEEYARIVEKLGRLPNYTETGLFSVLWSEHCSYKNSKPVLKKFPTQGERVLQGRGRSRRSGHRRREGCSLQNRKPQPPLSGGTLPRAATGWAASCGRVFHGCQTRGSPKLPALW